MRFKLAVFAVAVFAASSILAQTNTPPTTQKVTLADFQALLDQAAHNVNPATNLFTPGEVECRLGGCYAQATGEGGIVLAAEKWDVLKNGLGIGAEAIEGSVSGSSGTAAAFGYVAYRKTFGNVAPSAFVGAGYDWVNRKSMAVLGFRLEYRTTAHISTWASVAFAIEQNAKDRGVIAGGGLSYAF